MFKNPKKILMVKSTCVYVLSPQYVNMYINRIGFASYRGEGKTVSRERENAPRLAEDVPKKTSRGRKRVDERAKNDIKGVVPRGGTHKNILRIPITSSGYC